MTNNRSPSPTPIGSGGSGGGWATPTTATMAVANTATRRRAAPPRRDARRRRYDPRTGFTTTTFPDAQRAPLPAAHRAEDFGKLPGTSSRLKLEGRMMMRRSSDQKRAIRHG